LHGRVVAGLIAHTMEREHQDPAFHFSRLTVDMFRVAPYGPVSVTTEVIRDGNRIRVLDGAMVAGGVEIARGRAVMLRRADPLPADVWSPPGWDAPHPDTLTPPEPPAGRAERWMPTWETRPITGSFGTPGQKRSWLRESRLLIEGVELTPFVRAALVADFTNPLANSGASGLNYVNADVTLYLHREIAGEWIGVEVTNHQSSNGIAVGSCNLYDVEGPAGMSTVIGLSNRRKS
jgi:acyl-CoA thioesterase